MFFSFVKVLIVRDIGSYYARVMLAFGRLWRRPICVLGLSLLLTGCALNMGPQLVPQQPATSAAVATLLLTEPPAAAPTAATATTGSAPPTPTPPPTPAAPPPAPTSTPDPLVAYTIDGMRARAYPGGEIVSGELLQDNGAYTRYAITYPSDGITVTGTMNVPAGAGPYPVVVLLHGYYERDQYWPGAGTEQAADFFARNGYLAIAPDFRTWGGSGSGPSLFHMGLVADTINLISALPSLAQADATRVALWGHSMGGGVAAKVLVVDTRVAAAVLYAPNSADDADLIARWGPGCLPGQSAVDGDKCNPAEVISPDLPSGVGELYRRAAFDPAFLRRVAPIYHLDAVEAPVQIHIGTADGATLSQTPPEWSQKLHAALQAAGKEVEFFSYTGQGHFFEPESWLEMMGRALALFDERLKGQA